MLLNCLVVIIFVGFFLLFLDESVFRNYRRHFCFSNKYIEYIDRYKNDIL